MFLALRERGIGGSVEKPLARIQANGYGDIRMIRCPDRLFPIPAKTFKDNVMRLFEQEE